MLSYNVITGQNATTTLTHSHTLISSNWASQQTKIINNAESCLCKKPATGWVATELQHWRPGNVSALFRGSATQRNATATPHSHTGTPSTAIVHQSHHPLPVPLAFLLLTLLAVPSRQPVSFVFAFARLQNGYANIWLAVNRNKKQKSASSAFATGYLPAKALKYTEDRAPLSLRGGNCKLQPARRTNRDNSDAPSPAPMFLPSADYFTLREIWHLKIQNCLFISVKFKFPEFFFSIFNFLQFLQFLQFFEFLNFLNF